jgi:hypothetical protein
MATYVLPAALRSEVAQTTADLRKLVEHVSGEYLVYRHIPVVRFGEEKREVVVDAGDLLRFLKPLAGTLTLDSLDRRVVQSPAASLAGSAGRKLLRFAELNFYELRALICKKKSKVGSYAVSAVETGAIAGLVDWLMQNYGVHASFAKSLAVAILVALLTASKGAFCKMTEKAAKEAIERILA